MSVDNLFDYAAGLQLAIEGADAAHNADTDAFKNHVYDTVVTVGKLRPTFTNDDVIEFCLSHNLPLPDSGLAWGSVFRKMSHAGQIKATGEYRKSRRKSRHTGLLQVWRLV